MRKHSISNALFYLSLLGSPIMASSQQFIAPLNTIKINTKSSPNRSTSFRESAGFEYRMDSIVDMVVRDGKLLPGLKTTFGHNADGTVNHILYSRRNNIYQDSTSYNYINGRQTEVNSYVKNDKQSWTNVGTRFKTYEGYQLITEETQLYDTSLGGVKYAYKNVYSYNNMGRISAYDHLTKDNGQHTFESSQRSIYYYDSNQILDSIVKKQWNILNKQYENEAIVEFKYNAMGQQISYSERRHRTNDQSPWQKRETTYDENGNIMRFLDFSWDRTNAVWEYSSKIELKFSPQYNINNTSIPFNELEEISVKGSIESSEISTWNGNSRQWEIQSLSQVYYSSLAPTKTKQMEKSNLNIFPNPATSFLEIHSTSDFINKKIIIRNMIGEEVLQEKYSGIQNQISLKELQPGAYIISIESMGSTYTDRFIIVK